ncbi:MAG: dTDP-glucose 4,6-dehydratase [bacterium]
MKTILVTGGAGFIGSNFVPYFIEKYADYTIINLDKLTYAGNLDNLKEVDKNPRYKFIKGDICDNTLVEKIFKDHDIKGVIHFAAESHVDNSIKGPEVFIDTNIKGTFVLVNNARNHWIDKPFNYKKGYESCRFHHISTDEVYGTLGDTGLFKETTPYAPNSPYSASKASSDFIVRAYHHTYGLDVTITNCSNNYGPKQHDEKLIPTVIRSAINLKPIPVYGKGLNTRDWLYVLDHCSGIDAVFHKGKAGETYNIGSNNEQKNIDLVKELCNILDNKKPRKDGKSYKELITFVEDRAGHDWRYAIDSNKLEKDLSWKAKESFDSGLEKAVAYYLTKKTF